MMKAKYIPDGFMKWCRILFCMLLLAGVLAPSVSHADPEAAPTCTTDEQFKIPTITPGQGMLSTIVKDIQNILFGTTTPPTNGIAQNMFNTITGDGGFTKAVGALMTLYIAVYGILFTFGMVQLTLYDFVIRMIKVGILITLVSPGAWQFFNTHVVTFFNQGTDELINLMTNIAVGGVVNNINPTNGPAYPFAPLDAVVAKALSAKMWVTVLAIMFTGIYGLIYGVLLALALKALIAALLTAMWVYLMSLVLRTLLFGVAPIFLACMLFHRTRHLFDGWLNQVVSACLQPIFLFVFFAFFVKLMEGSIDNIITYDHVSKPPPICWSMPGESVRGTPFDKKWWRFTVWNSQTNRYEAYSGEWGWNGPTTARSNSATPQTLPLFPLDLLNILIFFMLAELAGRFNTIVIQIAKDLAGASTDLMGMQGSLSEWFSPGGGRGNSLASNVGARTGPGGRAGVALPPSSRSAANQAGASTGAAANTGGRGTPGR